MFASPYRMACALGFTPEGFARTRGWALDLAGSPRGTYKRSTTRSDGFPQTVQIRCGHIASIRRFGSAVGNVA